MANATEKPSSNLLPSLSLFDGVMIVLGCMIGSGIFIVPANMARSFQSPLVLLLAWALAGAMVIAAALTYAELGAALPLAGGQYVFLREAYGRLPAFVFGWGMLVVVQSSILAALAIAFAKFTGVLFPAVSAETWLWQGPVFGPYATAVGEMGPYVIGLNVQNLLAILTIVALTLVNSRGAKVGAVVQNFFTIMKVIALLGLLAFGFAAGTPGVLADNLQIPLGQFVQQRDLGQILTAIAAGMVGAVFSLDAFANLTFAAGEMRNPGKDLPRALIIGVLAALGLYLLANMAYLNVLPFYGDASGHDPLARGLMYAAEDRVGTAVLEVILGPFGAGLMAAGIMVSTFGGLNGNILAGSRVYYAMAKDGLFFKKVAQLNAHGVPALGLWLQSGWAMALCLTGSYNQLLDFIVFTVLLFHILSVTGIFVLRWRAPQLPRPYRVVGYPFVPLFYLFCAISLEILLLLYKPQFTWPGLILTASGIPIYWLWQRQGDRKA